MTGSRIAREKRTVAVMVRIYCRGKHGGNGLCDDCRDLLAYSMGKLDRCPYKDAKPTCARCTIHCYEPSRRSQMRSIMRYSGSRMFIWHPLMSLAHAADRMSKRPKQD